MKMSSQSASTVPHAKRQRLNAELAIASGTKVGAARVLQLLSDQGLLDSNFAPTSQRAARNDARLGIESVSAESTPYGPVIMELTMGSVKVEIVNPFAYLHVLCDKSPSLFKAIFPDRRGPVHRCIVLYIDEVRPGNPLRPDKSRQTQCVYWTFADFDDHLLNRADTWFVATTLRSTIMDCVPGKVSGVMRHIMNVFFANDGTSFATGVVLQSGNDTAVLTARFVGFLGDEKALKEIWCLKGASGSRPCITCTNLVQFVSAERMHGTTLQGLSCCDMSLLRRTTDDEVLAMADRLQALHDTGSSKAELHRLEQALGMTYVADGILYDKHLREANILKPVRMYLRDWMHTLVGHGVAGTQVAVVLAKLKGHGIKLSMVQDYMQCFVLPRCHGRVSATWFSANRVEPDHLKCFASEMLSIVPLFNEFLADVVAPRGIMPRDCMCFTLLNQIVQLLRAGPSAAAARSADLLSLTVEHHKLYADLYPENIKPKWHHMLHLHEHGSELGKMLACFVTERKHKAVKATGTWTFRHYEHTVLRSLVFQQAAAVVQDSVFRKEFLDNAQRIVGGDVQLDRSTSASLHCGTVFSDDLIACHCDTGKFIAKVVSFISANSGTDIYVHVVPMTVTRECNRTWFLQPDAAPILLASSDVLSPVMFASRDAGHVRIVPPERW